MLGWGRRGPATERPSRLQVPTHDRGVLPPGGIGVKWRCKTPGRVGSDSDSPPISRDQNAHPDAILLFRMGDFYETFDEDAELAAKELEITLTSRSMGKGLRVPLAGVPAHSLDNYLARLIKKGHKVAICEQLTDPATSKGLVERGVVRVITPGTVLESAILDQKTNNYLAAVFEGDARVGMAYVDISTGEFAATELDSHELPLELERIDPAEVLTKRSDEPIAWAISGNSGAPPRYEITSEEPRAFHPEEARQALLSHFGILTLESFGCEGMDLAVAAAGAIVGYLNRTQKAAKLRLSNLAIYSTSSFMALDAPTRRNLELFAAGRNESKELSLLAALDRTKTPMGGRLLRQWLGQPLLNLPELEERLDAVDHFYQDGLKRGSAISALTKVADLERIVGRIVSGTVSPRELIALKDGLAAVPDLEESLDSQFLVWLHGQLAPLPDVLFLDRGLHRPGPAGRRGRRQRYQARVLLGNRRAEKRFIQCPAVHRRSGTDRTGPNWDKGP